LQSATVLLLHVPTTQLPLLHVAVLTPGFIVQSMPHPEQLAVSVSVSVSQPSLVVPLQFAVFVLHVAIVHAPLGQPYVATLGSEHGVHDAPQLLVLVLLAHTVPPLHEWLPLGQFAPQVFPPQVAVPPPDGVGHIRHVPPLAPVPHSPGDCEVVTQPLVASQQPFVHVDDVQGTHEPLEQMLPFPHGVPSVTLVVALQA
jgi:hypothetical protein